MKACIIIPVYNHQQAIVKVVESLKSIGLFCFLINDGSSPECSAVLKQIAERESEWLMLHSRNQNGGKGAAVSDGFRLAIDQGFSHAIQIDADGQHNLRDISLFLDASEQYPEKMILGQPRFDQSVPKKRLYGRMFTNLWVWINTLSFAIADGMCGFRLYPLPAVDRLLQSSTVGQGMDFDIDIVVRLNWQGVDAINIPTDVQYPIDGISHFKMLSDNLIISKKHAQLFFGMLWRFPQLFMKNKP